MSDPSVSHPPIMMSTPFTGIPQQPGAVQGQPTVVSQLPLIVPGQQAPISNMSMGQPPIVPYTTPLPAGKRRRRSIDLLIHKFRWGPIKGALV